MSNLFKSPIKLPGGNEASLCFYPFKIDSYGLGCTHNCLYCYARSSLDFRGLWSSENPKPAKLSEVYDIFYKHFVKKEKTKYSNYLKYMIPVRIGGMSDGFCDIEDKFGTTKKLIELLNKFNYPYLILTKNKRIIQYKDILNKDLCCIQFTITTGYDELSKKMEEGASLSSERLQAVKELTDLGFYVQVRVNPLFPIRKDGFFSKNIQSRGFKYFDWDFIDMICKSGAKTLIAGFLRLSSFNIKWIEEKFGENLKRMFDDKNKKGALHFSREEKKYYYEKIKGICDNYGVDFSVCYDGDEDYEYFRYLRANKDDCCNIKGKVKGFYNNFIFNRK